MINSLEVKNFCKSYGSNDVIKDISFEVKKGEIFGVLGVNGAGKTTTLECIEGVLTYEKGSIDIKGTLGVQLQSTALPKNIKVIESFILFSKWNGTIVNLDLFNSFMLDSIKNKQYQELSTGQKRRLHLAIALIGNPDIIFLDEPTAGLDVESRVSLHRKIMKLKESGKTVVITSHDMAEVESLCDRVMILKDGKIAFIGPLDKIPSSYNMNSQILIRIDRTLSLNEQFEYCDYNGISTNYMKFSTNDITNALYEITNVLREKSISILDIKIAKETLEERFIEIAKEGN